MYRKAWFIACAAGAPLLWLTACWRAPSRPVSVQPMRAGGYRFINPLLECEGDLWQRELLRSFDRKLQNHVDKLLKEGHAEHIAVYFRDMNNGPWAGIRESDPFAPASLLKVPLMMALLKMAETDSALLEKRVFVDRVDDVLAQTPHFQSSRRVEAGREYSVDELIRLLIVYSDNNALKILLNQVNRASLEKVYGELQVPTPFSSHLKDFISVRQYASFFRILFNATYLNREMSEKALRLLAETEFNLGISAGLPPGVAAAHKYGERYEGPLKQLHDCGIVYVPGRPYLLAVMTRGDNFEELANVIADISRFIHAEVSRPSDQ
jgi:beta-lactamase class A